MNDKKITFKISMTGLSVALIIVAQMVGKILPTGFVILGPFSFNQLITGSLVNLILVFLTIKIGVSFSITAGILSSIMAMILQIGPIFPQLVVFIAMANVILVSIVYFIGLVKKENDQGYLLVLSVVVASIIKFIFLKFTVPISFQFIKDISPAQIKVLSIMFSWPQLITSLTGGSLALIVNKMLKYKVK